MLRSVAASFALSFSCLLLLGEVAALAATGGPITTLGVSPARASQRSPALSWDGTRYVLVFEEDRGGASGVDLVLTRVSAAGAALDPSGIPVVWPLPSGNQRTPAIAASPSGGVHFLTWVDPRAGSSDIYAARFLAGGAMPSIAEPEGIPLATGITASDPSIGCTAASCLAAFLVTGGGQVDLRGVRLDPGGAPIDVSPVNLVSDNTGRNTELSPAVLANGAGFALAWEDDRSVGAGLGAEIFGRIVPATGAVAIDAGIRLGGGPLRQSAPALAPLGGGLVVAWQDQRAATGTVADDDLWRVLVSLALAPAAAERAAVRTPKNQVLPELASSGSRALLVWEDFRSATFGAIAAGRLDASGAPIDGPGFVVAAAASHLIEHAVAKGPGDDYLLAWVQLSPAPARIHLRIVRDEPPAGLLTPPAAPRAPADGVTKANLRFGAARGASGFDVIDGTPYTLTLSRADLSIDVPDSDPQTPGHQLRSVGGEVTFGLSTTAAGPAGVTLRSVEGTATGSVSVRFDNVPPAADAATITPASPLSSEDLVLAYAYRDINADPESGTRIEWTKNLAIQSAHTNQRRVPASATRRGEQWRAQVLPSDGITVGPIAFSNVVVVLNSPPTASGLMITPSSAVRTGTRLVARWTYDDPDLDPESGSAVRWFEHGVEIAALAGSTEVPAAMVQKGQLYQVEVAPRDGMETGPAIRSATVAIENSPPVAEAGAMTSVAERGVLTLDGRGSSDADSQDALHFTWRQLAGPAITLDDSFAPTPRFTAPSIDSTTMLELGLVVSDGEASSSEDRVVVLVTPLPDADSDGLDDAEEAAAGTDPARGDSDRDGLQDGPEVRAGLDPNDEDSDDDGIRDGVEPGTLGEDRDGDGKTAALDPDSDGDGIADGTEAGLTSAPAGTDRARGFFVPDLDPATTTDPGRADTDGDGLDDGAEDTNHDGKLELGESDPNDATSTAGCAADRSCPDGQRCERDACRGGGGGDGGLTCRPLADRGTECCMGGCVAGTVVAPICVAAGALEQCPVGASQCSAGSCSGDAPPPAAGDSGCGCAAAPAGSSAGPVGWLLVLAAWVLRRRRFTTARRASPDRA